MHERSRPTMHNLHRLRPCRICCERMAGPRQAVCTVCDAVTVPGMVPDDLSSLG